MRRAWWRGRSGPPAEREHGPPRRSSGCVPSAPLAAGSGSCRSRGCGPRHPSAATPRSGRRTSGRRPAPAPWRRYPLPHPRLSPSTARPGNRVSLLSPYHLSTSGRRLRWPNCKRLQRVLSTAWASRRRRRRVWRRREHALVPRSPSPGPPCYGAWVQRFSAGVPDADWDRELLAAGGHFMQTGAWMAVQRARGEAVHQRGEGWRWAGVVHRGRGVRYLYLPYGPSLDDASRLDGAIAAIKAAGRELGADFVRIEPDVALSSVPVVAGVAAGPAVADTPARLRTIVRSALKAHGAVPTRPVQPRHTLVLDLSRSEEELRAEMQSGRRRSVNAAGRKGIQVRRTREPVEVERFIRLIGMTGERNRFDPQSDDYYRTVCSWLFAREAASLYLAEVDCATVAAVIAFETATTGYYAHAADDPERSRQIIAAAPLAWRIVLDCRAEGRRAFDFWGVIPDDRADHPWAGFSRFKKTFGGQLVTRPGTYDLALRPLRYGLYRLALRARARRGTRGPAGP